MFLEHNSNIVLEILDIIMLCKHNVPEAYFILRQIVQAMVIKVVTEVYQEPIRKDYTVLIKSTVDCIRTLEFRMNRAQSDFQKALKCPGTDPDLINRHATRLRLITAP